ncbi:MAG: hypothetical protein ACLRYY_14350 [Anaerobutyricum soehngenii]
MQNQEKNNSFLPSWMCETEQYVPSIDKDGFITKSTQAVLGVLSKLKWKEGKDGCLSASPSLKLCYTFLYILLTACSKNYVFSLIMAGGTILALATYPAETMKQILSGTFGAVLFSALILLPAVFIGNPQILLIITTKVFVSVTLIGILSAGTSWNKLTASLRSFHIPGYLYFYIGYYIKIYCRTRRNLHGNPYLTSLTICRTKQEKSTVLFWDIGDFLF